jgi:hypothetical protein
MSKKIENLNKENKQLNRDMSSIMRSRSNSNDKMSTPLPKRRGRRPKKILENEDDVVDDKQNAGSSAQDPAVILRLRANPSKLKGIGTKSSQEGNNNIKYIPEISDGDSSDDMFKNDIPLDSACHKCIKYEKTLSILKSRLEKYENREQKDRTTKIYNTKLSFVQIKNGKKFALKRTNQKCLWDGCTFTNLPFPLPEMFHKDNYYVIGLFCSPDCALAHNLYVLKDSKMYQRKSLVYKLYRELHSMGPNENITLKEAPPKELLEDYGGSMSIDTFRRNFQLLNKEYVVYVPPIKPLNIVIEETDLNTNDEISDNKYVLKRKKPLSKKKSVIASMNMNFEEDD